VPTGDASLHPEVRAAHDAAVARGQDGYVDPLSGFFVFTSTFLRDRGSCCGSGCRHCPYPLTDDD
jgi:hypothetical protein